MKNKLIALRLDNITLEKIKTIAPEGNVSMWIRMLIEKKLKKIEEPK